MTTDGAVLGIILAVLVGLAIALPFLIDRKKPSEVGISAHQLQERLSQLLSNIADLDFDFDTGKVSESDYVAQRKMLIGRGVSTLIHLDEALAEQDAVDEQIEEWVAAYRKRGVRRGSREIS
jgi:hypothetical protein